MNPTTTNDLSEALYVRRGSGDLRRLADPGDHVIDIRSHAIPPVRRTAPYRGGA
jgi:hypothetical protein